LRPTRTCWRRRSAGRHLRAHGTRDAFEKDHDRDLTLTLAGIETIRVRERQFRLEPDEIAARIATLLDRRERST
jgi:very-short-patch-repair endonuclease